MAEEGQKVTLNVYDLSQGLARQVSNSFLGKAIEGIWHTGIVVYGDEYYFGGGIQHTPSGKTPYGTPLQSVDLGVTKVTKDVFDSYIKEISPRYTNETYNLLKHNCNNFSNEVAQFLVGKTIPEYILNLPNDVLSSPLAPLMRLKTCQKEDVAFYDGKCQFLVGQRDFNQRDTIGFPIHVDSLQPFGKSDKYIKYAMDAANRNLLGKTVGVTLTVKNAYFTVPMLHSLEVTLKEGDVPQAVQFQPPNGLSESSKSQPSQSKGEKTQPPLVDPLGSARNQVQDEIAKEFAAIRAKGTLGPSEAAALATKNVMQKYGFLDAS